MGFRGSQVQILSSRLRKNEARRGGIRVGPRVYSGRNDKPCNRFRLLLWVAGGGPQLSMSSSVHGGQNVPASRGYSTCEYLCWTCTRARKCARPLPSGVQSSEILDILYCGPLPVTAARPGCASARRSARQYGRLRRPARRRRGPRRGRRPPARRCRRSGRRRRGRAHDGPARPP